MRFVSGLLIGVWRGWMAHHSRSSPVIGAGKPGDAISGECQDHRRAATRTAGPNELRSRALERTVEISTLGRCAVDGVTVSSRRAVELTALLVLSESHAQRDWLMANLFEGDPAPSSLPTLALRARKAGLPVRYERNQGSYWLTGTVSCDAASVLGLLRERRIEEALDRYTGPFLPMSHSPFAMEVRATVENALVTAVLGRADLDLMVRADRMVKHPKLSEELVRRGADRTVVSLSRSWLYSLDAVG